MIKIAKGKSCTMDLRIAAIDIANDAIHDTRKLVDFEKIQGLNAKVWT